MTKTKHNVEQILIAGNPVRFPITGWSMYPFLSDGDMVTVEPIGNRRLRINDAVLYRRTDGPLVLHRIIRINHDQIFCCGDNQTDIEGPLKREQMIGILQSYSHRGKQFNTDSSMYKLKTSIWRLLRPLRPFISKTVHRLKNKF